MSAPSTPSPTSHPSLVSPVRRIYDIVIIGAGVAGTSAASAFSAAGHAVALVDGRQTFPRVFRAEKIDDRQMAFLDRFGLGEVARAGMTAIGGAWVYRFGRVVDRQVRHEYSASYGDLVNVLRSGLPKAVDLIIDTVGDVRTSATTQTVQLRGGVELEGRLLVLATGVGETLSRKLGITRTTTSKNHSLSCGFDLTRPPADFPFPSLVWLTDRPSDRMAYLALFPIGAKMRGNLFVYRSVDEPWSKAFREDPGRVLHELLPRFEATFGRIEGVAPELYPVSLTAVEGHRQPGVVLIGDAFGTVCPVTGTGIHKALNDVDRLAQHVGGWLATPGMGLEKIGAYYDDPVKQQVDGESLRYSMTERAMQVDTSLFWTLRRARRSLIRRGGYAVRRIMSRPQAAAHHPSSIPPRAVLHAERPPE
jgi:2-polyprenyl-6-methoxyphenol hydroxylase-like FAD-dependent oxidoreductase